MKDKNQDAVELKPLKDIQITRDNSILFFGCPPARFMLKETKMVHEFCEQLLRFDKNTFAIDVGEKIDMMTFTAGDT